MLPFVAAVVLSQATLDPLGRGAWLADPTTDAVLLVTPRAGVETFSGCAWPSQLTVDSAGAAFVTCRAGGEVRRLESGRPPIAWRTGAEPAALALDEAAQRLYVGLATSNAVVMLDARDGTELARVNVGTEPTALGLFAGGLAVGSRKSDTVQVWTRDLRGVTTKVRLRPPDSGPLAKLGLGGRRVGKFVPGIVPAPLPITASLGVERFVPAGDGILLLAPHAEVGRIEEPSYYSSGDGFPVTQDLFVLDASSRLRRVRNLALPDISGAVVVNGIAKLTSRGRGGVVTVDLRRGAVDLEWELPTGVVALAGDARRTFVLDDVTREVRVREGERVETMSLGSGGDPELALGRMLFHRADDPRMAEAPLACASCHREGRDDGRTWLGQAGMRQTPMLAGRDIAHTGPYGWNGAYDTLEGYIDFTIRERMLGYGLPKADLRALARYVREGLRPVTREPAVRSAEVQRGRVVFHAGAAGCSTCHGAAESFTDGVGHDVGSLARREREAWQLSQPLITVVRASAPVLVVQSPPPVSRRDRNPTLAELLHGLSPGGQVAGQLPRVSREPAPVPLELRRFDTPSLLQASLTAPYLHDGSAKTLDDVLKRLGDHMGKVSALTARERGDLVAYLQTL